MGSNKQVDPFMGQLYECIVRDVSRKHSIELTGEMYREFGTLMHRDRKRFLTVDLPAYGKSLEKAILTSSVVTEVPAPCAFFKVLEDRFFATYDACLLRDIRQLTYLFYKYEIPYDKELEERVLKSFIEVDRALPEKVDPSQVTKEASVFISRLFQRFDHRDIFPKHGPGAVATGERVHEKSVFKRIYSGIEAVYSHCEYFRFSLSHVCDRLEEIQALRTLEHGTAKVVLVPKDSRGPRLISCEPLEYQWIQQGLSQKIVTLLESHPLTKGHVNFTDQRINRELSLLGSLGNQWSTLDMKEASDRVSLALVRELFSGTRVLEALLATRTSDTLLPNGQLVHLRKFAPMGSALCFPVESLVFYALAVATLKVRYRIPLKQAVKMVYVYGDDIIVKEGFEPFLFEAFEEVGLLFNRSKCCYTKTYFRESCGMDAFKGVDVTPLKMRCVWSSSSPTAFSSYISYANVLRARGYLESSRYIAHLLDAYYGPIAITTRYIEPGSYDPDRERNALALYVPGVNAVSLNRQRLKCRYNWHYQRYEVLAHAIRPMVIRTKNDGWEELLRKTMSGDVHSRVGEYSPPRRVELKRVWVEELL